MKRSLMILGKKWRVKMQKKIVCDDGKEAFGLCDPDNKLILIKSGMTKEHTTRVFWHEYCHARLHESGVVLNAGGISALAEEIICDTFADLLSYEITSEWKKPRRKKA